MGLNVNTILEIKRFMEDNMVDEYTLIFYELIETIHRNHISSSDLETFFYDNPSLHRIFSNDVDIFKRIISPIILEREKYDHLCFRDKLKYVETKIKTLVSHLNIKKNIYGNIKTIAPNENTSQGYIKKNNVNKNEISINRKQHNVNDRSITFSQPSKRYETQKVYNQNDQILDDHFHEEVDDEELTYYDTPPILGDNITEYIYNEEEEDDRYQSIPHNRHFEFSGSVPSTIYTPDQKMGKRMFTSIESHFSTPH